MSVEDEELLALALAIFNFYRPALTPEDGMVLKNILTSAVHGFDRVRLKYAHTFSHIFPSLTDLPAPVCFQSFLIFRTTCARLLSLMAWTLTRAGSHLQRRSTKPACAGELFSSLATLVLASQR